MTETFTPITSNSITENIKCFVRCRPLNEKEKELGVGCITISEESKTIFIDNKSDYKPCENKSYTMDHIFYGDSKQEEIFDMLAIPILKGFFQGFNCTVFAYGQTGAGKTHTMLGPLESVFMVNSENHGLIPRILHFIFDTIENNLEKAKIILNETSEIRNIESEVSCSCLEIYQEQIIDLLSTVTTFEDSKLVIREDAKRGMFIDGLTENIVKNDKSAMAMLMLGLKNRHVAATNMNAESSRSHLIFTIFMNLSYTRIDGSIISRSSRLHLIDLAGSERQKATKAVGERIKEAGMINKSLSTLGNVINALVWLGEGKSRYVPFRDSKLTYFLKDSLGGNAKTSIMANISQSIINLPETISTLKFVQRAKMIKNKPFINEKVNDKVKLLEEEVKKLREELISIVGGKNTNVISNKSIIGPNNFVCSLCQNKGDTNQAETIIKTENNTKCLDRDDINISKLIDKIKNLFNYEDELCSKFKLIDNMTVNTIEKFFVCTQIYENDTKMLFTSLDKKIKQFNNVLKFKENILNDVKQEIIKLKNGTKSDEIFLEKVETLTKELAEFRQDFEMNNLLSLTKLNEENKLLKSELEAMKNLKEYFVSINKYSENQKKFYDKTNIDRLESISKDFIKSNEELKNYFEKNFLKVGTENEEEIDKFIIISRNEIERMKFQLEEMKINEENNLKMIDELNSENFLMDMELAKYREKDKESIEKRLSKEFNTGGICKKHEDDNNINISEFKNENLNRYPENTPKKRSLNLISETINSKLNLNYGLNQNPSSTTMDLNLDKNYSDSHISEELKKEDNHTMKNNQFSNSNSETNNMAMSSSEKTKTPQNEFITNLRNSFANSSPIAKVLRSSILQSALTPRLKIHEEILHHNDNQNLPSKLRFSVDFMDLDFKNIPIENFEFLKLKQRLDDALINLEEKNEEITDKNEEIEELRAKIEELNMEKERIQIILNQQNEEIETINESNRFMQIDLISINKKFNLLKKHNNDIISEIEEISEKLKISDAYVDKLSLNYQTLCSKFYGIMNEKIKNSPIFVTRVVSNILNTTNSNFSNHIEYILKEVNNVIVINEIKIEKIKGQLITLIENANKKHNYLLHNIKILKEENSNYEKKFLQIKSYFGDKFDYDFTNLNNRPFSVKIDKSKFNKLEKRILELKEEKNQLKTDIALLKIDFNKSLSDKALDSKIHLLMRIKEENHNLKLELIEMKKKNEILEKTIINLQDHMNKPIFTDVDEYTTITLSNTSIPNSQNSPKINLEEAIKTKREHKELIDYITEIGNGMKKEIKQNISFHDKKNRFDRAMDVLKNTHDILISQIQKFNVDQISLNNSNIASNSSNIAANTQSTKITNTPIPKKVKYETEINKTNILHPPKSIGVTPYTTYCGPSELSPKHSSNKSKNDFSLTPTKTLSKNKDISTKKSNPNVNKSIPKIGNEKITSFKNPDENSNKSVNSNHTQLSHTPGKTRSYNTNTNINSTLNTNLNPNVRRIKIDIKSNLKSAYRSNSNKDASK